MNMRLFLPAAFLAAFLLSTPASVYADTSCVTSDGTPGIVVNGVCSTTGNQCSSAARGSSCVTSSGTSGVCDGSGACVTGDFQCRIVSSGSSCGISQGVNGTCSAAGACQANRPPGEGNPNNRPPGEGNPGEGLLNPLKANTLQEFLRGVLEVIVRLGAIVVVLMLVFVGFKFVTAQGEPGKISEAKQALLWTLVGALILLGAQAIAIGIEATTRAIGG